MTTVYPNAIDNTVTLPTVVDGVTTATGDNINIPRDAIIAIETELGVDPSREFETVRQRLDYLQDGYGGIINNPYILQIKKDNSLIVSPTNKINFKGNNISVTNAGSQQADVEILYQTAIQQETIPVTDNQTIIPLTHLPVQPETVQMFVMGIKQVYGTNYTVAGNLVNYIPNPPLVAPLASSDSVEFYYIISGGSAVQETIPVYTNGQILFALSQTPSSNSSVEMYLNGQKQEYNIEYTISGATVTYTGAFPLVTTDIVEFWYIISSFGGSGGGAESLNQVLTIGNVTGGHNIVVSPGDNINSLSGLLSLASDVDITGHLTVDGFTTLGGTVTTTDTTPTAIYSYTTATDSVTNIYTIVSAYEATGTLGSVWTVSAGFKNVAGTVSQIGTASILSVDKQDVSLDVIYTVATNIITFKVIGSSNSVKWKAAAQIVTVS